VRTLLRAQAVLGVGFVGWQFSSFQAKDVDPKLLESDARIEVRSDEALTTFTPKTAGKNAGLVFLPGGMVDPDAYVPLLRSVAERGHPVALVRLPWRSAPTAAMAEDVGVQIEKALDSDPTRKWVLAGHSRGGALAAKYASRNGSRLAALVLVGTTHPKDTSSDLSASKIPVTKIVGTEDGVAPEARSRENARFLPPTTQWVVIQGGNHAQFGHYGPQLGDRPASITRERQQTQTADALVNVLRATGSALSGGELRILR